MSALSMTKATSALAACRSSIATPLWTSLRTQWSIRAVAATCSSCIGVPCWAPCGCSCYTQCPASSRSSHSSTSAGSPYWRLFGGTLWMHCRCRQGLSPTWTPRTTTRKSWQTRLPSVAATFWPVSSLASSMMTTDPSVQVDRARWRRFILLHLFSLCLLPSVRYLLMSFWCSSLGRYTRLISFGWYELCICHSCYVCYSISIKIALPAKYLKQNRGSTVCAGPTFGCRWCVSGLCWPLHFGKQECTWDIWGLVSLEHSCSLCFLCLNPYAQRKEFRTVS